MSFYDTDKLTFVIPATYINLRHMSKLVTLTISFLLLFVERAELIH